MMGKSSGCRTCKKWAEHYYWDISDNEDKCFFKVIMDDLHEMTIPAKFAARFKGKISGTIKLEARSGSICDIAVKTCGDKMILQSGWEKFVNEHDLGKGDFLVFRYNGDSQFKVGIFDLSGCEKASSCVSMNNPRRAKTGKSSYEQHSRKSVDYTMEKRSSSTPSEEQGDASSSQDDFSSNNVPPYVVGSYLTQVQEDKVKEIVQAINSDIPIHVTVMFKSHVNRHKCGFEFLKRFGDKYLPQEKQRVLLQLCGERWKMWLNAATASRGRRLMHGWRQFVMDNDLQIGDICLFDLLNDKKMCTISVHIIRARKRGRQ
ncbi:putative B3 domain-containing protein Os03g0621600 isoform X2 [Lolium rigidum]|nr:putative B3 domain-containing protein Os03g0621600 isoform X2 [Lolium rigidum]